MKPVNPGIRVIFALLLMSSMVLPLAAAEADKFRDVVIKTIKVSDGIYMLQGSGGNIGVSVGEDGVLMIDDQFAPLADRIKKAIAEISEEPVRFLLNTHWHYDHTGGNESFGKHGATIVAHDNVHKRMSVDTDMAPFGPVVPASPDSALPIITYNDRMTFRLNANEIQVFHASNAHTDGDSVVYFVEANVMHTGDIFSHAQYPFIDSASNGSIDGIIATVESLLKIVNDETKIIPGHGPLVGKKELEHYHEVLVTLRSRMQALIDEGKSIEEIIALKPFAEYDAELGNNFLNPEAFLRVLHLNMTR